MSELLEKVERERMLRNAYRFYRRIRENRCAPLWAFVRDITNYGSTFSMTVCLELGWDPYMEVGDNLPPRRPTQIPTPAEAAGQQDMLDIPTFLRTHKD